MISLPPGPGQDLADLMDKDPIEMETFYSPAALAQAREPWTTWALDLLRTLDPSTDWDEAMVEDTDSTVEGRMRTALERLLPTSRGTSPTD